MLAVRIQAIDGTGTFTPQDSQPCRLLPPVLRFECSLTAARARLGARMDSLLLSCRDLSSPTPCRFIPTLTSPIPVFLRHTDHEILNFLSDAWPPRPSLGTAVILFGNQLAVPGQQCVGRNEVGNFVQYSTADKFRFRR